MSRPKVLSVANDSYSVGNMAMSIEVSLYVTHGCQTCLGNCHVYQLKY